MFKQSPNDILDVLEMHRQAKHLAEYGGSDDLQDTAVEGTSQYLYGVQRQEM